MTSFNTGMQNEKIAAIALVIIIVGSLSGYLVVTYREDILKNLFGGKKGEEVIALGLGDCADVHYIGRYASNNTVFDSSYADVENKTGGTPLNIFVSLNATEMPPEGYETYTSEMIEGFMEGLIGLKEGETATIGPIPPEKAYGVYPKIGDVMNITDPETGQEISIHIVDIQENASMPEEYVDTLGNGTTTLFVIKIETYALNERFTLYQVWENATEVTKINETTMWIYTTPPEDKMTNFTWKEIDAYTRAEILYWESASSVTTMNDTTLVVTQTPDIGATIEIPDWYGSTIVYAVVNLTEDKINTIYIDSVGNISYQEFDRTITIVRNETQQISFSYPTEGFEYLLDVIKLYDPELNLSTHDLAGETLYFEVEIVKIYKTS